MDTATTLPHVNAILNTVTIVLLVAAYWLVRNNRIEAHRKVMLGALTVSALFLASYLTYHFTAPIFVFRGDRVSAFGLLYATCQPCGFGGGRDADDPSDGLARAEAS